MITIGLVGGVASGKSAVAAALAHRGAVVFDADRVGHQVLDEPEIRRQLVDRWGPEVLGPNGQIARPAVAARVFGDSEADKAELRWLEELVHPRIRERIVAEVARLPDESVPAVVIDAALLFESGWSDVCQVVAFVDAPRQARLQRALTRGWSPEEFSRREAAQMPIEEKRQLSSHLIDNSGSLADLHTEVGQFWNEVVG
jgi:dephospho-CoA kinase